MSFHLHPFAVSNIFIVLVYFFLFLILIKGNFRIYALHMLAVTTWGLGAGLGTIFPYNTTYSSFFLKVGFIGVIFIPTLLLHAFYELIKRKNVLILSSCYLLSFIFSYLTIMPKKMFSFQYLAEWDFLYYSGNALTLISFIFWLLTLTYAHFLITKSYKNKSNFNQHIFMALVFGLFGYIGGINNFLPIFNIKIYPWGNFFIAPSGLFTTYCIFRHQAFDIKIALEKSIVYSTLIAIISVLYLVIVLALERAFAYFFNYQSMTISIAAAFGIGLLVFPLRNKIQKIMDRYFFSGTQAEIYEQNQMLRAEVAQTERLKTASTLASGLAHEIKNPLTAINTFAEYLNKKQDDPEFLKTFSPIIEKEAQRINELVNQLTDFAKPSETKIEPYRMHDIIDFEIKFLGGQFIKNKIKVDLQFNTPNDFTISVNHKTIKQALLNILLNAVDAMPNGGTITIRDEITDETTDRRPQTTDNTKNPSVVRSPLSVVPNQKIYRLLIKDTGTGIAEKDIPHLFDPFFTKKDAGTGLGLSVTYGIIKEHGGKISAINNNDAPGATFIIELPITKK